MKVSVMIEKLKQFLPNQEVFLMDSWCDTNDDIVIFQEDDGSVMISENGFGRG